MNSPSFLPRIGIAVTALALAPAASVALAQAPRTFASQYSFGDSLSDNGNLFAFTGGTQPPAPYFNGRFSNGPVFTELLGTGLQPVATAAPSARTNLNFAFAGATAAPGSPVPSLAQQIGLMQQRGIAPGAGDLFTVLAGANDVINALGNPATLTPAAVSAAGTTAAASVAGAVQTLLGAGAKNVLVLNLPDIARTARFTTGTAAPAAPLAHAGSAAFNTEIRTRLAALAPAADARLTLFDLGAFFDHALANSTALGFATTSQEFVGQLIAGQNPGNPAGYFFWDGIHPTTQVHAVLAQAVTEALNPELVLATAAPQGGALLALASANLETLHQQVRRRRADSTPDRIGAWFNFAHQNGSRDAQPQPWTPRFEFDLDAYTGGIDAKITEHVTLGAAVTSSLLQARANRVGRFHARGETFSVLAAWRADRWFADAVASYGRHDLTGIRRVTAFGGMETGARTESTERSVSLRAGRAFRAGAAARITPWVGLRRTQVDVDGYREDGVPSLNFAFAPARTRSTEASAGVAFAHAFRATAALPLELGLDVAYVSPVSRGERTLRGALSDTVSTPVALRLRDGEGQRLELGGSLRGTIAKRWGWAAGYAREGRRDGDAGHRFSLALDTRF